MKVPLSWLKDYVDVDIDPHELARRITLAGVEAEEVVVTGQTWGGVVVGLVEAVNPHPDADRLTLATVDTGQGKETVVCGAPNVAAGQKIAFARVGATLIDAHTGKPSLLKAARIRGVESAGMVCSERELGLSDEHEGILVLAEDAPVGATFADYYGDAVIDFTPTPNRPDCLSMLGIAREASAVTGKAVREPSLEYEQAAGPVEPKTSVEVLDPDLCPRYIAGVITGVTVGPSPRWLQDRLHAIGARSINNVVDVTNYVMMEYGQPLHAFDYDRLAEGRIVVRRARRGERMTTIDGESRALSSDTLVIADAKKAVAVAGVMGGVDSEVSGGTTTVLLESAAFNNVSIRRTSRELGLRSEASTRFDKGLSPELPLYAARRAMQLLVQITGGSACRGFADAYPGKSSRQPIRLTVQRTEKVLGVSMTPQEMALVIAPLGFEATPESDTALSVTVPYWRMDVAIEDDLIEEVVRTKGYDWVPTTTLGGRLPAFEPQPMITLKEAVRDHLAAAGLDEVVTYPLTNLNLADDSRYGIPPVRLSNPLSSEMAELRLSLRDSLLRTLAANQRNVDGGVRLFEVGRVYQPRAEDLPDEREVVAAVLSGPRGEPFWQAEPEEMDFFDAKGVLEALLGGLGVTATHTPVELPVLHPARTAQVSVNGKTVGFLGELHPKSRRAFDLIDRPVLYLEIDLSDLLGLLPEQSKIFSPIQKFPGLLRDLALVLDESIPAERVIEIIRGAPLVQRVTLFDLYVGEQVPKGKKSLAFRLVYQSPGRTLTGEEADRNQERLLQRLQKKLGATLRG